MTAADNTFARFVEELERSLDEPSLTGAELASRLHISRFHFDRLVSATAGEAPGQLRRRVLLERAAWRLLTTSDDVLDVALDAGYSSHEAFTRAFGRAFDASPSTFRRSSARFELPTESRVHFNPPGGLRFLANGKVTTMDLLLKMIEHHLWLVGEMITAAERLDESQLDRPIELNVEGVDRDPTLRSLLSRLVGQLAMWDDSIHKRTYDFSVEEHESLSSMRERLAEHGPAFLGEMRTIIDEGRLDETFVDATCEPARVFTYGGVISHVLTFAAHRRTLVCGALETYGITDLGAGDPMLWVAGQA